LAFEIRLHVKHVAQTAACGVASMSTDMENL
jgi:hypothetical protein